MHSNQLQFGYEEALQRKQKQRQ
uniref:Uncharacterized protein n=1 Tax=Rhizophora mucronata TaxID=61149 RepID=A0A2P2JIJ0_RHIMU